MMLENCCYDFWTAYTQYGKAGIVCLANWYMWKAPTFMIFTKDWIFNKKEGFTPICGDWKKI